MSVEVKNRRGTTVEHSTFTGAVAEITVDTDKNTAVVHDGVTAGGHPVALSADFGTATAADLTTSPTDTTAGRVLKVGAGYQQLDANLYRKGNTASQAEAEAGTINDKPMTPLRTKQAFDAHLGSYGYSEETVTLPSSWNSAVLKIVRVGDTVTISSSGAISHASLSYIQLNGIIPSTHCPDANVRYLVTHTNWGTSFATISSSGALSIQYRDHTGATISRTNPEGQLNFSYTI